MVVGSISTGSPEDTKKEGRSCAILHYRQRL
jgi:hypothetical protein